MQQTCQNKGLSTCEWVDISSGSVAPAPIMPEPRSLLQIIPLPHYTCSPNQKFIRAVAISGKGVDNNMTGTIDILEPAVPDEMHTDISSDTTLCEGKQVQLYASGGDFYEWSPPDGLSCTSCPSPIASPKTTTTYTVIIRNRFGCESQQNVSVTVTPALGNPNSLHVISLLTDGNFSFGQIPIGAIHCQWLHLKNSSDNSIILNSLSLHNNTVFSVPQNQFPLTIQANSIEFMSV